MATSDNYLGNRLLKRSAIAHNWDKQRIEEYKRCALDPIYFIRNYCKIIHVDRGLVNFDLYAFQERMVKKMVKNRFFIAKLARQVGKTTTVSAFILHSVLFTENYSVAILANKDRQAKEILSRIQLMFEHLPKWLQQGVVEWNKGNIELENRSKVIASATSSTAIRGGSFNCVYLDEFAFVPRNIQEEFFASVYPTISSGKSTKVLITSTPNGMDLFYKIWNDSENKRNQYVRMTADWSDIPGRDAKWKRETISNTSERQFRQEYECEFLGSSDTLIEPTVLGRLTYDEPVQLSGNVRIFEPPKEDHMYLVSADTAGGVGMDYSAFIVADITEMPYKVVATYRDNMIVPMMYPNVLYNIGRHYNYAYMLVEVNTYGNQVVDILLHDMGYENILSTRNRGKFGNIVGELHGARIGLGVTTTKQVKRIGCTNLKSIIENDKFLVTDYLIINELMRFIAVGNSYEAEAGEHDDLAMCCVLFAWLVDQDFFKELTDSDARIEILKNNERYMEENVAPFGFIESEDFGDPFAVEDNLDDQFNKWF